MSRQSARTLKRMLESVEADLCTLGLQAQLLRHFVNNRPTRRAAAENRSRRPGRQTRPGDC